MPTQQESTDTENEQFVNVFCLGKYGLVSTGKLVYPEYNDDIHSAEHLDYLV